MKDGKGNPRENESGERQGGKEGRSKIGNGKGKGREGKKGREGREGWKMTFWNVAGWVKRIKIFGRD